MLKASHRRLDPSRSRPAEPVHAHTVAEPLPPGEVVCMDVALLPSATLFRAGDELRLDVQGRWFFRTNPLTGQLPARYQAGQRTRCVLHAGGQRESWLRIPMTPM
jgi:predicted acyl esterase